MIRRNRHELQLTASWLRSRCNTDDGEALWSFGALATIKASAETTDGRVAVIQQLAPQGAGSPLHVHHREDEWFYVIEGELTFWVGGQVIDGAGRSRSSMARAISRTPSMSASEQARFLLVTEPAGFEDFMRAAGQPAPALTIPPPPTEAPDPAQMASVAGEYGIEILGPPGIPS